MTPSENQSEIVNETELVELIDSLCTLFNISMAEYYTSSVPFTYFSHSRNISIQYELSQLSLLPRLQVLWLENMESNADEEYSDSS